MLAKSESEHTIIDLAFNTTALRELSQTPFPRTGSAMLEFEQRVYATAIQLGDQVTRQQIERAHKDAAVVGGVAKSAAPPGQAATPYWPRSALPTAPRRRPVARSRCTSCSVLPTAKRPRLWPGAACPATSPPW